MKYIKYMSVLFVCMFAFSIFSPHAFASGSCSSNGVGTSWNTAADWTGACTGAGGIPGTGDNVTITAGHPITLDVNTPSLGQLTIIDTLDTSSSNYSINVTSGTGELFINSGGTLIANASTVTVSGWFYDSLGAFIPGTSTVAIALNGDTTVVYGNVTFYNLTFTPAITGDDRYYISDAFTVSNNFTINPTAGSAHSLTFSLEAPVAVTGTLSITGSGSATSVFDTGGNTVSAGLISIGGAGTLLGNASTINVTGTSGTLLTDSGTFTAGTSTVNLSGNGSATINTGSPTFYNLTSSGTGTKTVGGGGISFASGGTLSLTNGTFNSNTLINSGAGATLDVTNATILVPTAFQVEYPFDTVTLGTGSTANYNEGSPQTIESSHTYYNLTISGAFSKTVNGTTNVLGTLTVNSGTFSTGSDYTLNAGAIAANGGSLFLNNSTVNLTGTSGTLYTVGAGGLSEGESTINLTGNGDAIFNSAVLTLYNVTVSGTGTKSLGGPLSIDNNATLSLTNGLLDPGTYTITGGTNSTLAVSDGDSLQINTATFSGNYAGFTAVTFASGTIADYASSGSQTIDHTIAYYTLGLQGGSGTKSLDGPTTVAGNLIIGTGVTLDATASNYPITVGGGWWNSGTFNARAGLVTLNVPSTDAISGTTTFYDLTVSAGKSIVFPTGMTTTVSHAFTAAGSAGNTVTLASQTPGTKWPFLPQGTSTVSFTEVEDGGCAVGAVTAIESNFISGGNNDSCWPTPVVASVAQTYSHGGIAAPFVSVLPVGGGNLDFILDGGKKVASSPILTLSMNAAAATVKGYAISLDPTFADGGINPYTGANATFTLPNVSGTYTVYLKYYSTTGNVSQLLSKDISYDKNGSSLDAPVPAAFKRTLRFGSTGGDVKNLQQFLNARGFTVSKAGAGSVGNESNFFGAKVLTAVKLYQKANGITPVSGIVGPITLQAMQADAEALR